MLCTFISGIFRLHNFMVRNITVCTIRKTRLALTSVLGPFGVHLLKFILPTRCIDALFGARIPFQSLVQSPEDNPDSSPPVQSPVMFTKVIERPWEIDTRDLPIFILWHQKRLVFLLNLALFRLVGLSKQKIIESSLTAFTGCPFALVFTCTSSECVNCQGKSKSLTGKTIRSRKKAHGKGKSLTAKTNSLSAKAN